MKKYTCDICGARAVLFVDRDISSIRYDENGELTEEIVDGEKQATLCRECAGPDARYVPPAPWEKDEGQDS